MSIEVLGSVLKAEQIKQLDEPAPLLRRQIDQLEAIGAGFLTVSDPEYPRILLSSLRDSTPPILTYLGNLDLLQMSAVGFCGSRKASSKGLEVAKDCSDQLSRQNIAIISGHAAGVDQQTHYAALEAGGSTIVVLPEGLLNFKIRRILKQVWDYERVLVISEFAPNAGWTASRAMQRNKTIVGLSQAMILIEAGRIGGSMDAGKKTLAMKKKLYTPVYEGMPDFAVGNQILLEQGAIPIMKSKSTGKANLSSLVDFLSISDECTSGTQLNLI